MPEYGRSYIVSADGLLKLIQSFLLFITLIFISHFGWGYHDVLKILMFGIISGTIYSFFFLFLGVTGCVQTILRHQGWGQLILFVYLLAINIYIVIEYNLFSLRSGAIFGILASVAYFGDAIRSFVEYKPCCASDRMADVETSTGSNEDSTIAP